MNPIYNSVWYTPTSRRRYHQLSGLSLFLLYLHAINSLHAINRYTHTDSQPRSSANLSQYINNNNNNNNLLYHTLLLLMNLIVRDANISYGLLNWHSRYPAPRPYETTEENFDFSCTRQWKTIKRCDRCTLELLPKRPIMNHYARAKHSSFLLRFRRLFYNTLAWLLWIGNAIHNGMV